mmetsp:Transcript_36474/g.77574  ORF Transcript_36474/g.77574 Transcript_36474/m.77574 type:complete len:584 (-) Transcript_36474:38-1789(-)
MDQDREGQRPPDLRGVPTHLLLRRLGRVFANGSGEASTFAMSAQVERIDVFLSHSWATPSILKTVALMYRSNVSVALILSTSVLIVIQVLRRIIDEDFLRIKTLPFYFPGGGEPVHVHLSVNVLVYCCIFAIALIYGAEIGRCCFRYSMYFLDKCCIHQTDPVKKMQGIHQLGDILAHSKRMVVLWQPEYLSRLWCVWELAAFSSLSEGSVEFLPLKLPLFVIGLFAFHFGATVGVVFVGPRLLYSKRFAELAGELLPPAGQLTLNLFLLFLFNFLVFSWAGTFFWKFCIWHMDDRRDLIRELKHFKVEDAKCFLPADRVFMLSSIEGWFGSVEHFEALVQEDLSNNVASSLHHSGPVPFSMLIVGALPHAFIFGDALLDSSNYYDLESFLRFLALCLSLTFCTDALSVDIGLFLAEWSRGAEGRSWRWTYFGPICVASVFAALTALPACFMNRTLPLWIVLVLIFVLLSTTMLLHWPRRTSESWTLPSLSRGSMRVASISSISHEGSITATSRGEGDSQEMQCKTSQVLSCCGSTYPIIEEGEEGSASRDHLGADCAKGHIVKLDDIYNSEDPASVETASCN